VIHKAKVLKKEYHDAENSPPSESKDQGKDTRRGNLKRVKGKRRRNTRDCPQDNEKKFLRLIERKV